MMLRSKLLRPIIALAILAVLTFLALDTRLKVVRYSIPAPVNLRIAMITDLHSCYCGEGERDLISAVDNSHPDIVVFVGDIFDHKLSDSNSNTFLAAMSERYKCYFVTGNHEYSNGKKRLAVRLERLEEMGITVLRGDVDTISVDGQRLTIAGVDDPRCWGATEDDAVVASYEEQLEAVSSDYFTILLAHRPEYIDLYSGYGFDVVLSGHAHGEQWRIPGLINGVYAPSEGLLPSYAGGLYNHDSTTMIVSRGLARETTKVPRIFNRPELVVVEMTAVPN